MIGIGSHDGWSVVLALLAGAMVLVFLRLLRGPKTADRVVALDQFVTATMAAIAVAAIRYEATALLDVAMIMALVSFVGTVAFARYLETRRPRG